MNEKKDDYFGEDAKEWKWSSFKTTKGYKVSKKLIDWIIGQEKAIMECNLCIDEWIDKLKYLKKKKWWNAFATPMGEKPPPKDMPPAGPFLLLLGDAGTGKSLLGRAMAGHMTELYKKNNLFLHDVVSWKNPVIPSEPKISIHPSPKGKELVKEYYGKERKKTVWSRWGMKILQATLIILGILLLSITLYSIVVPWIRNDETGWGWRTQERYDYNFMTYLMAILPNSAPLLVAGGSLLFFGFFLGMIGRMFGNMGTSQGIGGAQATNAPKLLIDNSTGRTPFIDATGHGSAQLYGSIAWDPYQTGGLGTPEHQRVSAGDVHRAHLGILYIDEVKNLTGIEAITLLTVLEDGQLPIALRSQFHGGDTAAMAVSTEPVPCMVFLIAAGNLDSLPNIHPALKDRIEGYGKTVYMNNDMPNTVENRRKFIQFMSQEIKRFHLLPFEREACIMIIEEARRKSGKKSRLTCKFRPMISIIKTASVLARNEGLKSVSVKQVDEAINKHCKTIVQQFMEKEIENEELYMVLDPKAEPKLGQINGLAIQGDPHDALIGAMLPIKASMVKVKRQNKNMVFGYFNVTGVSPEEGSWVQGSITKVRHVFSQLYDKDLAVDYETHIDFAQRIGVDGPSAGVAMLLALISVYTGKKIRQDIAVTGEINVGIGKEMLVTPIGGTHEKILAAQRWGCTKVLIPEANYRVNIKPEDYKIEVVPCRTLQDYMKHILVD